MTRDEAWTALVRRGVDVAVVRFSGGNDEGGADDITLCKREGNTSVVVAELAPGGWSYSSAGPTRGEDADLTDALEQPVDDAYGGFAGEFQVEGEVTWDVAKRTITMSKSEQVWTDYDEEVEV